MNFKSGFQLGEWTVLPLRGEVTSKTNSHRLQPKAMDVLLILVENATNVVTREQLVTAVWGERAISDEPLTRCIGDLRRALGDVSRKPEYILTVPKRGYRLIKQGTLLAPSAAVNNRTDAPKAQRPHLEISQCSIAVLPFLDLSSHDHHEYLSDGISEELLNLLAQIREIRVISRTSSFSYKDKRVDMPTIAAELNVAHVLEGSVRHSGDRVRITVQLIDAPSDTHLWSETYDRELGDIFAIQDEIAAAVVGQLKVTLLGKIPRVSETASEAYSLFLQARHFSMRVTSEDIEHANELYSKALAIDPSYAPAWVGLASNYNNLATGSVIARDKGFSLARNAAKRALSINPSCAFALANLGWTAMWYDHDLTLAARCYEQAIKLDPTDLRVIGNAALLVKGLGRLNEAISLLEYHFARDPVNPTTHFNLGLGYLSAGRRDEAIELLEMVLRLSPGYLGARAFIGTALLMRGEAMAALERMEREPSEPYRLLGMAMARNALAQKGNSDALLGEMIKKYGLEWAYNIAYAFAYCNETDKAFDWLNRAVELGDPGLADIVTEIMFSRLHLDPRWAEILQRVGKTPGQLHAIKFNIDNL